MYSLTGLTSPLLFSNFLNALTHPFVAQGLLTFFIFIEGFKSVKRHSNSVLLYRISISLLFAVFIYVFYAHVCVDTRYLFVMQNNHPFQAIHYRIASLWSHHETSLFIWLVILNITTYILRLPSELTQFRDRILGLLNCLLGFYMLVEANPFATTPFAQLMQESRGLNPLLYDVNMVWHPPLLYLGATWLFTPYVLSFWLYRTGDPTVIPLIHKQTKMAFGLLTLAIALGSFWAFTQLGWGGFWFWDPVETASLLPWLAALIVFHNKPLTLKKYPWIGSLPFASVMLSFWAVRSGILASVHSFANDTMAFWLLGTLMVFICVPVLIFALSTVIPRRDLRIFGHANVNIWNFISTLKTICFPYNKDFRITPQNDRGKSIGLYLLALNFVLLVLGLFIPVILDFSLAPAFFNTILLPIWIVIIFLMVLAPYERFRLRSSTTVALLGLIIYVILYWHLALHYFLLGASGAVCVSAMIPLIRTKPRMAFSHMGIGLCLIGFASYSTSPSEVILTLSRNSPVVHNAYHIKFENTYEVIEPFKTDQMTQISIHLHDGSSLVLTPARQFFHSSKLQRIKADFGWLNQRVVMITNIETLPNARVAITFHEKTGLLWIVLGCSLVVGAIFASFRLKLKF